MLNDQDKKYIQERGSDFSLVAEQIENFKKGFPYLNIKKAAAIGDGIIELDEASLVNWIKVYEAKVTTKKVLKFVPASGAATRMFKELFAYLEDGNYDGNKAIQVFKKGLNEFAFYKTLVSKFDNMQTASVHQIVDELLSDKGMSYGSLPKGLLQFHKYGKESRTPIEEHLVEGAQYARSSGSKVNIHFTVSPNHLSRFEALINSVKSTYESAHGVSFEVTYSQQKNSTDTIAVDINNEPFIDSDGSILFRPAGHGALLENLNDLDADVIFIKNIDNVVPDQFRDDTLKYKKALAGILLNSQEEIFNLLNSDIENPDELANTLKLKFSIDMGDQFTLLSKEEKTLKIKEKLNRPIRVCGMVKNTGEPGGGPFWVNELDGSFSLQIAETAQIDLDDVNTAAMLKNSTHFNPVDLICATKNHEGKKFDLLQYRDNDTGFITLKSKNGKELKAMELPGLWNGAMANWITLFVEVPISTFSPVKTVNDLLKTEHQSA
jgi:hypothetical protein